MWFKVSTARDGNFLKWKGCVTPACFLPCMLGMLIRAARAPQLSVVEVPSIDIPIWTECLRTRMRP